ncbi:MAG TPA: tRNA adenosine(34) deaminase TadA [Candidatus Dormibacteraeota bacterium]|nr:tRNA adenosine(34) deaminase TadA [Candidatus Dormibacteraeota bacterium]
MTADIDELWMRRALSVARRAGARGEVPVGAIAVRDGERICTAGNRVETGHDATAHAEMLCLRRAASRLQSWRLNDVTLYVTLEPCPMCASAMVLSRLGRLVYAAKDPKKGADGSAYRLLDHPANNHLVSVRAGVMAGEASAMLSTFFQELRAC